MTTWAVTDKLRIYRDGKLVAEFGRDQLPILLVDIAKLLRG